MTDDEYQRQEHIPTLNMIYNLLLKVQENTNSLMTDNKQTKKELVEIRSSLNAHSAIAGELA